MLKKICSFLQRNQNEIIEIIIPHPQILEKYLGISFSELNIAADNITIVKFIAGDDKDDDDLMKIYRIKLLSGKEEDVFKKGGINRY